ncbi:carboxypeptidase-like regulatory domain-containing protein [Olivibacter ginsenosidimutans]|uniref:carboxypeptidase-like regulatory domain-containing protein n=1 Tax=Olivibacter ginsenosidimutans TaxID=1176537 RepID=UPI0031EDDA40
MPKKKQVQGKLQTKEGKPIPYANVVIKNPIGQIVAFKASDSEGYFAILLPDSIKVKTLLLEVKHLGYKTVSIAMTIPKNYYALLMEEEAIDLSEVEVKSRPHIDKRGDTLIYQVQSFAKNEDRSIGDVIRRMPGMEVGDNGEIKYNGKSIANFYIDGDNLLDDKYAIGSKTIPHGMVKGVEVLQNHQPIKVLQNKRYSDDVAINLVIKEEAKLKLTGQAKVGAGLPDQYDEELNALLFNKKYKLLNVLKGNNVGEDLSADFTAFNRSSFLADIGNEHPGSLLSSGTAGLPALPKNRFYLNNSASLNANNLTHLKKGLLLKSNINLLLDKNRLDYRGLNELYLEHDTIRYTEQQVITRKPFLTDVMLTAEDNKENHYIKDELRFSYSGSAMPSALSRDNLVMNQQLKERISDFSNHFQYVPQLRNKNIITVAWYTNYYNRPQTLSISPGVNPNVLYDSSTYASTKQFVEIPSWFNKASLAYGLVKGFLKQQYGVGLIHEQQQMQSDLHFMQLDGSEHRYSLEGTNRLHWNRNRFYVDATYGFKKDRINATLALPFAWQTVNYRDRSFNLDTAKRQWLFNPSFRMQIRVGAEDFIALNYAYANQLGDISQVYRGAVLVNYRSLMANRAGLREEKSHRVRLRYNFQRSVDLLFVNTGLDWSRATADAILSSRVTNQLTQTILVPLSNNVSTFSAYGGISKYIFGLGATTALKASWSTSRFNQLLNEQLLPYSNTIFSLSPSIEARLWELFSLSYQATATWTASKLADGKLQLSLPEQAIQLYDQSLMLNLTPNKRWLVGVNGRHLLTLQKHAQTIRYFFIDAHLRYTVNKWHSDIELNLTNLADIKTYEAYSLTANQFWYNRYILRGRMAVLKYTFTIR